MWCRRLRPPLLFNALNAPRVLGNRLRQSAALQIRAYSVRSQKVSPSEPVASPTRLETHGILVPMTKIEQAEVIARANEVWPPPPFVPDNWSSTWEDWRHLLTMFWFSPYYLMIPQIEMILNIRHRIPGEARPVLFSTVHEVFIFTIVQSPEAFYMYNISEDVLYRLVNVKNEQELVELVDQGDSAIQGRVHKVSPDDDGQKAVMRILDRDPSVIPLLAQKFLGYTPKPTTLSDEGLHREDIPVEDLLREYQETRKLLSNAQQVEFDQLVSADVERDASGLITENEILEYRSGLGGENGAHEEDEVDEDEDGDEEFDDESDEELNELRAMEDYVDNLENMEDIEELMKGIQEEGRPERT